VQVPAALSIHALAVEEKIALLMQEGIYGEDITMLMKLYDMVALAPS